MKIGDLWVKLGLKKEEFSKGMKLADGEVKGFAASMKSMSAAAKVAWGAVAAAVVKFSKDAISMTQKWGDAWNQTMAGIKGAYSSFVRQISSGDGWNNLFANMRESYRVSKEVAAALDEIFERKTSFSYQEAAAEKEIARLQLIARDSSKSDAERIAANKKIITETEKLGAAKKAIYEDEAANIRKQFRDQTKLNDDEIDFLVKEYNQNRDNINQAREYLRLRKELSSTSTYAFGSTLQQGGTADYAYAGQIRSDAQQALEKLERETPQAIKDIAELTKKYDRTNDELVKGLADAEVAVIRIDTETMHAQTRATALLGTLQRVASSSSGTENAQAVDALEEDLKLIRQDIEELEELLAEEDALNEWSRNYIETFAELNGISLDPLGDEIRGFTDTVLGEVDREEAALQLMRDLLADFRDAAIEGFSESVQELADQFAGLEEINPGKVVQALLTPLADMAIKEGEILMAMGVGVQAVKEGLDTLNPYVQLAAGAALIAIGAAAKSGLAALAKSGASSTATTSYGTAGSSAAQTQTIQTEMTVYVTGRLSGSDILLSGQKTQSNWNR